MRNHDYLIVAAMVAATIASSAWSMWPAHQKPPTPQPQAAMYSGGGVANCVSVNSSGVISATGGACMASATVTIVSPIEKDITAPFYSVIQSDDVYMVLVLLGAWEQRVYLPALKQATTVCLRNKGTMPAQIVSINDAFNLKTEEIACLTVDRHGRWVHG